MTTQTQTIFHPSAEKRRILIVEDEAVNQMILSRFLEDVYEVIPAMNGTEAMELIHAQYEAISLILLDLNLPDIHGLDILRRLNANPHYARIPVIVMTADGKAELDCLTLGAIDFIPKPYPQQEIVLARIRRIVELSEDRDLLHWTERDHLTGLYNKDFFFRYASMLDDYHKTLETDVMVVDVNRFHTINNRFGKACGDRVLRQIAEQALELVHASGGIVCRSEADTFYLYCPHRSDYGEILEKLSVRLEGEGGENRVRLRMGVYSAADKSLDIERRFDRAKMAADAVKGSAASAVGLYDHSMYEEELFTEQLIEAFPEALREKQFTVYFQPKFDIRADEPVLCSAEALARWKHPQMGMISPGVFIPLFENNGLIQALDHFIWSEAAAEVRRLKERLDVCIPVSINVSRIDLLDPMLTEKLRGIVEDNGLDYGSLILEVTESAYTEDSGQIVEAVKKLREMGFVIEMDDFGTGYSSLNMLSSLPIDVLKLDMKFIRSALRDQKATRLLEAIIHLAESIDVPCTAEGVEEAGQVAELKRMGCDYIQGYETVRIARIHSWEDRDDYDVHSVGACFVDSDSATRSAMEQRQALSDALAAAEDASRAKTTFLSNMSHEIRTPMNAIIGLDSIALKDPDTPAQTREYLEQIGASAEHLLNLINDILDMSRIESGRLTLRNEEFSFAHLLEAVNTMFSSQCRDKGLEYECRLNTEVDDYYIGDNMKLRQALINILGNAVKFTPVGGRVELDVARKARFDGKTTMEFKISDTGIGISREFIPRLFDTFSQEDGSTTNKYGSSGLGLAITKSIVEMMNGSIEVESVKGRGSTFTVTVTLSDAAHVKTAGDTPEIHPSEMTVLIVDDAPMSCEHARLVLEKAGIAAEIADSGAQAIEMVKLRHARREPYNLILVDWQMPEMDGVETTRRIRAVTGDESAIIILTAYNWDDILDEAVQAGVDSFIAKPLFAAAVLEEFSAALQRKNSAALKEKEQAELNGRRVLLAEDMQVNVRIMTMVLKARGVGADLAENGKIAVEKMAASPEGYYSAILMDIRMPEMDGLEATRLIRSMERPDAKTIPIIALTANAFDEDVQRSLQAGMNAHLSKPVKPEALYETLEGLIRA